MRGPAEGGTTRPPSPAPKRAVSSPLGSALSESRTALMRSLLLVVLFVIHCEHRLGRLRYEREHLFRSPRVDGSVRTGAEVRRGAWRGLGRHRDHAQPDIGRPSHKHTLTAHAIIRTRHAHAPLPTRHHAAAAGA